jgi:CubicO group peptidase (beta-lactamase class C family)
VIVIKKGSIIVLLGIGLILPVCQWRATADGVNSGLAEFCDGKPCEKLIENRITCFMPPAPPKNCKNKDCHTPGFALAIIKDDKVIFERGKGFANIERDEEITTNTIFDLASLTKQFTAAGIMMLIEDPAIKLKNGYRLTVDTSLSDILNDFTPAQSKDIILADLLTHQSGLPDYIAEYQRHHTFDFKKNLKEGKPSWYETMDHRDKREELTTEGAFKLIVEAEPRRGKDPGTDFNYSNSGYVVLARIIEELSHKTYKQFMKEKIFDPLGMTNTSVFDEHSAKISGHAFPYRQHEGKYFVMEGYTPINFVYGDGNIHSTLSDMIKWVQALDKIEHGRAGALLKRETLVTAFQSTRLREDISKPLRYGFGWFVARKNTESDGPTTRVIYHGGDWYGFHSYMLNGRVERSESPVCELTMIVLSNFEPEVHDQSQNRPCHLATELSRFFWGGNKAQNIILDDNKMFCGSEPKPTCAPLVRCPSTTGN